MDNNQFGGRWAFDRAIEYLKKNDLQNAKMSFMSDIQKGGVQGMEYQMASMIVMLASNKTELIKAMAGFSFMPPDIRCFYDNPEGAMK